MLTPSRLSQAITAIRSVIEGGRVTGLEKPYAMQLRPKRILVILAGLAFVLWLGASSGLYFFIQYSKGYEAIRYTDVAFPWNWSRIRPKWGDYFIEKGLRHLEAREWNQAFYYIRLGVAKSPGNLEGRLAMADMLFQANEVVRAVQVLEAGLENAARNEAFWEKMIRFLEYYQADRVIIRILEKGLDENLVPDSALSAARSALAKAYYHQADYAKAGEVIGPAPSISIRVLNSRIHFDQGLEELALAELEALRAAHPNHREVVTRLTWLYRQLGEDDKALSLARQTYLSNPFSVGTAVNYFGVLGPEANPEIERFLELVPQIYQDEGSLYELLHYLAEAGEPALQSIIMERAERSTARAPMMWFLALEARINAGQHEAASAMLAQPPEAVNLMIPLHNILFHSLSLTNAYALGVDDEGDVALKELVSAGYIRPSALLRICQKLLDLGRPDRAKDIAEYLLKQNPGNQPALVYRIQADLMLGDTQAVLSQSKGMVDRKTLPFKLKREIVRHLASDENTFVAEAGERITQILDTLTPAKRIELLESL